MKVSALLVAALLVAAPLSFTGCSSSADNQPYAMRGEQQDRQVTYPKDAWHSDDALSTNSDYRRAGNGGYYNGYNTNNYDNGYNNSPNNPNNPSNMNNMNDMNNSDANNR